RRRWRLFRLVARAARGNDEHEHCAGDPPGDADHGRSFLLAFPVQGSQVDFADAGGLGWGGGTSDAAPRNTSATTLRSARTPRASRSSGSSMTAPVFTCVPSPRAVAARSKFWTPM